MSQAVKDFIVELDSNLVNILVHIETLENMQMQLANVRTNLELYKEKKQMMTLSNISTIAILDDLLFYTVNDLKKNYKQIRTILDDLSNEVT